MLTIGILFCDRDLEYLYDLLKTIPYKIKIPYEVILFDNRDDFTTDVSFLDGYKVLNKNGGNIRQLVGRKKIIEEASGDFVWFVDADDELFEIDESFLSLLQSDYDFVSFAFLIKSKDGEFWNELADKVIMGNLLRPEANNTPSCLWNKWIKTTVLKKVIEYIPDDARVSASEDLVYVLGALKFGKSQIQSSSYVYTFNAENSCSGIIDYSGFLEKFKRCFFGLQEANKIIKSFMTADDLSKLELDLDKNDCMFFLNKVLLTDDKETKAEMFEMLKEEFSESVIVETWKELLNTQEMTIEQHEQMNELIVAEYGADVLMTETTTVFIWDDGTQEVVTQKEVPTYKELFLRI